MDSAYSRFTLYEGLAGRGGRGYFSETISEECFFVSHHAYATICIARTPSGYYSSSSATLHDCGFCSPVTNDNYPVSTETKARIDAISETLVRIAGYTKRGHRLTSAERKLIDLLNTQICARQIEPFPERVQLSLFNF